MKNHIQKGDVITVAAPAGGIGAGEGAIIGNIFGVAAFAAAVGEPVELATTGVYQLPKATTAVLTLGARVAWDNTAKNINVPGTGRFPAGIATEAAGNGITSVAVRLDGVGTVAA
ncbi:MAG: capsid cement protein [Paracoccaceae bacterium]